MTVSVYEVKKLRKIREQLVEIAEQEATKLFRLARRAETHGCSNETVEAIRGKFSCTEDAVEDVLSMAYGTYEIDYVVLRKDGAICRTQNT